MQVLLCRCTISGIARGSLKGKIHKAISTLNSSSTIYKLSERTQEETAGKTQEIPLAEINAQAEVQRLGPGQPALESRQ